MTTRAAAFNTPDLTFKQHTSSVSVSCFYQLQQIRSVLRSLDDESTATLVHAFVASRVDYCCSLLFGSPNTVKLQRVLNAAARVVTNTRKYDRGLHHAMRHDLHWLDMIDRIQFRIAVTMYHCLHGTAPEYLSELLVPASTRSSRHCFRSSDSNQFVVPPVKLSTYGRRVFSVSGPVVWNSLRIISETTHYPMIRSGAISKSTFVHVINQLTTP